MQLTGKISVFVLFRYESST